MGGFHLLDPQAFQFRDRRWTKASARSGRQLAQVANDNGTASAGRQVFIIDKRPMADDAALVCPRPARRGH